MAGGNRFLTFRQGLNVLKAFYLDNTEVTSTAAELNRVDVTAGTLTASKAIVVDANSHIDALKVSASGLAIGTAGAETVVTATGAELNYVDVTTVGTGQATKALVLDASLAQAITGVKPASVATTPGTAAATLATWVGGQGGFTTIATTGVGGVGGGFAITGGAGGTAAAAVTAGTGGAGGAITLTTGAGAVSAVTGAGNGTGGAGGALSLVAGVGGAVTTSTGTNTGGAGGAVAITAGVGGAAQDGTDTGGAGGSVTITAGAGGAGDTGGAGGNIVLTPGAAGSGGSPAAGKVKINSATSFTANSTTAVTLTNLGPAGLSGGTLNVAKWLTILDQAGATCYIPVWQPA